MDMTNKEYGQYVNAKSKPSPLGRDMLWAFVVGGLICTVGQALLNLYQNAGMGRDDAGSAVSMTLNRLRLKLRSYLLERGFEL